MDVVSLSPLRVASLVWQPRRGAWVLTVVCKATFKLLPGTSRLSESQEYPNDDDNHWNDDAGRSLYSPSDLCPFKQRADVMLVGHAFAPRGETATSLVARLAVGALDKSIEVWGDRAFLPDGTLREAARFSKMPLRYERAWAGPDGANPVGMRADAPDAYGAIPVPNLQRRGDYVTSPATQLEPAGFGPIAPGWPDRARKVGRRAQLHALLQQPLPDDLDPRFWNAAPADQQVDSLAHDAMILLEHLHPDHPRLVTSLPGIHPRAYVERPRSGPEELELVCDTLWIDTDRSLATLTWRGQLVVEGPAAPGRVLVAMENPGEDVTFAEVLELADVDLAVADDEEGTLLVDVRAIDSGTKTRIVVTPPRKADPAPPSSPPASTTAPGDRAPASAPAVAPSRPLSATHEDAHRVVVPDHPAEGALHNALPFVPVSSIADPHTVFDAHVPDATPPWLRRAAPAEPSPALPFTAPPTPPPPVAAKPASMPPPKPAAPEPKPASAPPPAPPEVVELLWLDATANARLRRDPELGALVPARPAADPGEDADAAEARDRREVFAAITRAAARDADGVAAAIGRAIAPDGEFVPPLVVASGELALPFDEVATLKATVAAVTPVVALDPALRELCASASELCASPWLDGAGALAEAFTARLRDAFARASTGLPPAYLASGTERLLLEQRAFQRRTVLGERHLRALLTLPGDDAPLPVYLPEALATRLPLFRAMRVRVLAEAHMQQDAAEASGTALRVLALGRVLPAYRAAR